MSESASQDLVTLSFLLPSILVCDVLVPELRHRGVRGVQQQVSLAAAQDGDLCPAPHHRQCAGKNTSTAAVFSHRNTLPEASLRAFTCALLNWGGGGRGVHTAV